MSKVNPDHSIQSFDLQKLLKPELLSLLHLVTSEATSRRVPLYIVGGGVRDLLLGYPVADLDLVVEGDAIQLARALRKKHGGEVSVHARFGTAQWFLPDSLDKATPGSSPLDLVSARSEMYRKPAALPTVHFGSISDDLQRRDFTINALAVRLDGDHFGEMLDEAGGLNDLQHEQLRVLHPNSFIDDPTRLFRLIRYQQRYGFQIAPDTLALIPDAIAGIKLLSAERVRHELDLVLEEENAVGMLQHMGELGILESVHTALVWNKAAASRFLTAKRSSKADDEQLSRIRLNWTLWLIDIPKKWLMSIDKRLHFDVHSREVILAASGLWAKRDSLKGKKPSAIMALLEGIPTGAIHSVALASSPGPIRDNLINYLKTWRHVKSKTNGNDLKRRGLPPGPAYQTILRSLRDAWLDGKIKTNEDENLFLEKILKRLAERGKPASRRT
jgi:tRNA nucleotidyltransferase (CCA-adding enzyme)